MLDDHPNEEIEEAASPSTSSASDAVRLSFHDLRGLVDASPDCIKLVALDGAVIYINDNGQRALEIDDFEEVAGRNWLSLWPEHAQELVLKAMASAINGHTKRFEALCPTAKGTRKWWDVSV